MYVQVQTTNFDSNGIWGCALVDRCVAPSRSKDIQQIINRALIGGILSCMLRASIAGILYKPTNEFYYGTHSESFGCLIDGNQTKDYNPYGCDLRCIEKFENQELGQKNSN